MLFKAAKYVTIGLSLALLAGCAGDVNTLRPVTSNRVEQPTSLPEVELTSHFTGQVPESKQAEPDEKSKANGNNDATSKPAPIRTFWQAVRAYCTRLHSLPSNEEKKDAGNDDAKPDGKNGDNGNGKNGDPKPGAKNPDNSNGKNGNAKPDGKNDDTKPGAKNPDSSNDKNGGDDKPTKSEPENQWLSTHFQATFDAQHHGAFRSPYAGNFSLFPFSETRSSETATIFLDARLWEVGSYTGELIVNPETAGGKGFSGVNGIAGFPNGDITRVGVPEPTAYFARLLLRQTWGLGGEQEKVDDGPNQIAGKRDIDRFTLSLGKFAITDVIDTNTYSHDPRSQFQNWSMMYNGAWDYPANVRGYGYGIFMELNQKDWALRYAAFSEPSISNGAPIDPHFLKANGHALEWEGRWTVDEHPGKVRLMAYLNHAHMGDYREALLASPVNPDVIATRSYRYKYGYGLNVEQEITRDLGFWGRLGWSDGSTESWAFTPIDRSAALGLLLKGRRWARPNDEVGVGTVWNGLALAHRDYLRAGGNDFSIGDGQLNYGLEKIIEVYYRLAVVKGIYVNADFQELWNPAYNRDRGPVSIVSMMLHAEF